MKKFFENKPRAWFIIGSIFVLIITALALLAGYFYAAEKKKNDPNVLAIVGGVSITKEDLNKRAYSETFGGTLEEPMGMDEKNKKRYLDALIEEKIIETEAPKYGVVITEEQINKTALEGGNPVLEYKEPERTIALERIKSFLTIEEFKSKLTYGKSGQYLLFRFDKYYPFGEIDIPGEGDQSKIDEQKEYAKKIADNVYEKLEKGEIDFQGAIDIVNQDPVISFEALSPMRANIYGLFADEEYSSKEGYFNPGVYEGFYEAVSDTSVGEYSKPFVVKGYPGDQTEGDKDEVFYAIAIVEKETGGEIDGYKGAYNDWLKQKMIEYKVKIYYSKAGIDTPDEEYGDISFSLINEAIASTDYTCAQSVSGTHNTQLRAISYYVTASNTWSRYALNRVQFETAENYEGFVRANSTCTGLISTRDKLLYKPARDDGDNAGITQLYATYDTSNHQTGDAQRARVFDCNSGSFVKYRFQSNDPRIPNTVDGVSGHDYWDRVSSSWTKPPKYFDGQTYDNQWYSAATAHDTHLYIGVSLRTSTNWANGTLVTKRALYKPHYNNPPVITPYAPQSATGGHSVSNHPVYNVSTTTTAAWLNASIYDPDNDSMTATVAIAKSTDGGNSWLQSWSGGGLTTTQTYAYKSISVDANVNRTLYSFAPSDLGVGLYKWVVTVKDEHNLYNTNPPGSTNMYNHGDPWYFEIVNTVPCTISNYTATSGGTTVGASGTLNTPVGSNVTFITASTNASSTSFDNGLGSSSLTQTYPTAGTYTANYSCQGLNGGTGMSYWIRVNVVAPNISCTATPQSGIAPRTVRFNVVGTNLNTTNFFLNPGGNISRLAYTFNTGVPYSKTVFYTYNSAGEYDAFITHGDFPGVDLLCGVTISIENPGSGSGGEVAP